MMKYKGAIFGTILFVTLTLLLQFTSEYHFYYVEQFQLFQLSEAYIAGKLFQPGGVAFLIGEFLTQFFILPYGGAVVVALLLTAIGLLTRAITRRLTTDEWTALYLLPVLMLLLIQFYFNYLLEGTVAYLFCMASFWLYGYFRTFSYRLVAGLLLVPLLFWWGGSVAGLLVVGMLVWEALLRPRRGWLIALTAVEWIILAVGSFYWIAITEWRFAFLPDMYYHHLLKPKPVIYFSWIVLPLIPVMVFLLRKRGGKSKKATAAVFAVQLIAILALAYWLIPQHLDKPSYQLKRLDYYARTQQWDEIIQASSGAIKNFLYLNYLNMALVEKGELANRLFFFDQHGPQGILCDWNKTFAASCLLSEVYFSQGEIALSQQMAFESFQSVVGDGNPRNLQRLVQTNLIFGEYAVAERYIRILERMFGYRKWATAHRRFLYNDAAVEADPLLGAKRLFLPSENTLAHLSGMESDLHYRIEHFPSDPLPIQLIGSIYLLAKNTDAFRQLIETYYGTPVLPALPYSFQEAVIFLNDQDPAYWQRFRVADAIVQRFEGYRNTVLRNRNNTQALPGLLGGSYGNSFWYYYQFK